MFCVLWLDLDNWRGLLQCSVIDVQTLTLVPKITRSQDSSPGVSAASSDRGSGKKGGFLRSRKSKEAPSGPAAVAASRDDDHISVSQDEAPVIRDPVLRGIYLSIYFGCPF